MRRFGPGWKAAFIELLIVIGGVLIALAANSWWDSRQNLARERTELELLLNTTRENEQRILQSAYEDSITYASATTLRDILESDGPLTVDSMANWLQRSGWFSDFQLITGPSDALVESGAVRLIRDPELRNRIVIYAGELNNGVTTFREYDGFALRAIERSTEVPQMAQMFRLRRVNTTENARAIDLAAFRRDPQTTAIVSRLTFSSSFRLQHYRMMLAQTVTMRRALEDHLGQETFRPAPMRPRPDMLPGASIDSLRSSIR